MQAKFFKFNDTIEFASLYLNNCQTQRFVSSTGNISHYGNTGCGVFKQGVQNQKDFCLRINIGTQSRLLNYENWVDGEVSKTAKT